MKYIFILFFSVFSFTLKAQQEEYTAFLELALDAAVNNDEKTFLTNLRYFSTAIERDEISPDLLTDKNFKLFSKCLYNAIVNEFEFTQDLSEQAFKFLNYKIDEYPDNMASLGYLYYIGAGVEQDYKISKNWYEKAASKGHKGAMYSLGLFYVNGWGVEKNDQKAFEWFEKSAFLEHPDGMYNLGWLYYHGRGTSQDLTAAVYWFKKAAENDLAAAMYNLAYCYYYGDGVPRNYTLAKHWLEKNLENEENPQAMYMLATIYHNGLETSKDVDKALALYSQGCNLGNNYACDDYNTITKINKGYSPFLKQAMVAVESYDVENFHKNMFDFVKAMEKDKVTPDMLTKENFELYNNCLAEGLAREFYYGKETDEQLVSLISYKIDENPDYMYYLGSYYLQTFNRDKAYYWLNKAYENGNIKSMGGLGILYKNSSSEYYDLALARKWLEKGASKGDTIAMYHLGLSYIYVDEESIEPDYAKARYWFEKASKNHLGAAAYLAWLYYDGLGGKSNKNEAKRLCEKAIVSVENHELCNHILFIN